jgi:hypothetical protein
MKRMLVLAVLLACAKPTTKRRYWQLVALDDGSALVTWHDPGRTFGVSRLDPTGRERWSTDLEGRPAASFGDRGVFVTDRQVILRTYQRSERLALAEGVSLETGRHSWTTRLRAVKSSDEGVDPFSGYVSKSSVGLFLRSPGSGGELIDVDPLTGRELGRKQLPISTTIGAEPRPLDDALVVHDGDAAVVATGKDVTTSKSRGYGCAIENDYWRLVRTAANWELAPLRTTTRVPIPIAPSEQDVYLQGCGVYRGSFVVFLRGMPNELRILEETGNVLHRADLDGQLRVASSPEPLTRFVPVALGAVDEVFTVLDLERGVVAWRAPSPRLADIFRSGDRWYWSWLEKTGQTIVVLDGATGVAKAVKVRAPSVLQFGPRNVAGDSVWLLPSLDFTRGTMPPVARLDASTLQVKVATTDFDIVEVPLDSLNQARNP